jgi:hypothetical protein
VPPEVESLGEIGNLERFVAETNDDAARAKAVKKLALLKTRLDNLYYEKTVAKLGR